VTRPTEVAAGLYRLDTTVTGTDMPLAIYLVEGERWLVSDTGCVGMMRDLAIPAAQQLRPGSTIGRAVVTHAHADHFGGNAELLAADPACRIFVHAIDAAWARDPAWHVRDAYDALGADYPCSDEIKGWVAGLLGSPTPVERLEAGDRLALDDGRDLRVIHLPGHSRGHIGLWEAQGGVLLLSDALLGSGQRVGGRVVAIPSYLDVDAYLASIRTVRALAPTLTCPAHYPVMDAAETLAFCDESERFVQHLDTAIRDRLADGEPHTLQQITASVVPIVAPDAEPSVVAGLSVQAHLDAFERHGLASWTVRDRQRAWTLP
jgi:glyoxylase-like metal-dependent hydrolase (beta-lactamase superfamily II)